MMNKMGLGLAHLVEFYGWKNVVIANRENHWQCEGAANAMQEPFKVGLERIGCPQRTEIRYVLTCGQRGRHHKV